MRWISFPRQSVGVVVVLIVLMLACVGGIVAPARAAPQSSQTHKLLIRSTGVGANYSLTVSGKIVTSPHEQTDSNTSTQVNGHVGKKDTVDSITYTGHITSFKASNPKLKATLDGTFLDASILDTNHIQLTSPTGGKSAQPVQYTIRVNKTIVSGEGIEERDSPTNKTTVTGWLLPGDSDGFYFRGKIVSSTTSVSGVANVSVNGKSRSLGTSSLNASLKSSPTPQSSPTNRSQPHTLVIEQVDGSVSYTITIAGNITLAKTESSDSIAGQTVIGHVGAMSRNETATDPKDVIRFTGKIDTFKYNGDSGTIRVKLDGKEVDPGSLANTPQPTQSTPSSTTTNTSTAQPTATAQPTTSSSSTGSDSGSSSSSMSMFIVGVLMSLVIVFVGVVAILYVR